MSSIMNHLMDIAAGCFGLACGSFLNVVIYRLPRARSIVRPRSSCTACGRLIPWYENVPVMSYLALHGRCSACGSRIPVRYPIVELLGGCLCVLCIRLYGPSIEAAVAYGFLMALLAVTLIDWEHRIIPDQISISFILIGLVWSFFNPSLTPARSLTGALAGGGSLYVVGALYRRVRHVEGMGGGDIKLMAMIGAFLGIELVLPVIVIASFFGALYGVAIMRGGAGKRTAVAFGSFLAPAAAFCLLFGEQVVSWYLGRF